MYITFAQHMYTTHVYNTCIQHVNNMYTTHVFNTCTQHMYTRCIQNVYNMYTTPDWATWVVCCLYKPS